CPFGCDHGICKPDPCIGLICNQPPPPVCEDPSTVRSYSATGTCKAGACAYASAFTLCSAPPHATGPACAGGRCVFAACEAGFADCDGNFPNGCEIDLQNDRLNCGKCGN